MTSSTGTGTPGKGNGNYFTDTTYSYAGDILVYDSDTTDSTDMGLIIDNGNSSQVITFSGAVSGNGTISILSSAPSTGITFKFTGDMSAYTGNMKGANSNQFEFNGATSGTGTLTTTNKVTVVGSTMNNSAITAGTLDVSGKSSFAGDVSLGGLVVDSDSKVTFDGDSSLTIASTIDNKGSLVLNGTLAVRNNDLSGFDSQRIGNVEEVTENGLFDIGVKYNLIKGNALDASSSTTTVSYNGQTYNIADGITIGEIGYAVVESDKTVTLGGLNATEGTADATSIYVHGGKLAIAEGNYTVNTSSVGDCDIIYTAGSMNLAANAKLQTVSGDISAIVKNSTGSGTLEIGNGVTNLISGNNTTYGYDGKISVKSGGQLNLNQQGNGSNEMKTISLAKATIDMDGGKVRYFGGNATIGTINVNTASTFEAYATWKGTDNQGVITIDNLNVSKALTITGQHESSFVIKNMTLNDTMLLNGHTSGNGQYSYVTIENLSGTGKLQLLTGHYTLGAGTHTIAAIDAGNSGNNTGTLTLAAGANLTVNDMWVGLQEKTAGIKLGKGATLTHDVVKFTGTTESNSSISRVTDGSHGGQYSVGNASYVISNAAVEVKSDNENIMYNRLMGVALSNNGTGKLTVGNSNNNLTELQALAGNIDLTWYNVQGNQGTISNLTIAERKTVGAYVGAAGSSDKATVTVSGLTAEASATLNANLILINGASLTLDSALSMGSSSLTLGKSLTLDSATLQKIYSLEGDDRLDLFTNVSSLVLNGKTYTKGTHILDANSNIDFTDWFTLNNQEMIEVLSATAKTPTELGGGYYLGYDANGTVFVGMMVPEPTTATLSLLALAGLAARRRRR
ncbi:MAG: PEP-CTERM sorting domain-containing protein [Akkermansia sp.]|nr:PEP-CTERM sorting domain-containing protein [Akkermansia sp.]